MTTKFKELGVMKCKPCAMKWKKSLKAKGKKCRIQKVKSGYKVMRGI
jgi:hypothetical protein